MLQLDHITLPSDQDSAGRTLGDDEIQLLAEAIESGTLTSTKGTFVRQFEQAFADRYGVAMACACSSGTAALHAAFAAIDPEPGDEIVTTPITDMGAITPILYQSAVPVFADVDPTDCNVTAESIERVLSPRTRAIVVTHLFGKPCDMNGIMAVARARSIPVIEDGAQSLLATHQGLMTGTIGDLGCFSFQQGKHITCGEGGIVVTDNPDLARRVRLFVNKAWGYGDTNPDHYFLALNYRMTELQGAVLSAQLEKLDDGVMRRIAAAEHLSNRLQGTSGIALPTARRGDSHAFWRYCLMVDPNVISGGANALGARLRDDGIACAPRYIQKPAFECQVLAEQRTFGNSRFPFSEARAEAVDYDPERFPGCYEGLANILVLPWNEQLVTTHVDFVADSILSAVSYLTGGSTDGR